MSGRMHLASLALLSASCSGQGAPTYSVNHQGILIDTGPRQAMGCVRRLNVWQGTRVVFESRTFRSCARHIFVSDNANSSAGSGTYAVVLVFDDTPEGEVIFANRNAT
jgi:hypothetical protein